MDWVADVFSRVGYIQIAIVAALYLMWGSMLVAGYKIDTIAGMLALRFAPFFSPIGAGLLMMIAADLAFVGLMINDGAAFTFALTFFVVMTLISIFWQAASGYYSDGARREKAFIFADQLPLILILLGYIIAVFARWALK